MMTRSRRSSVLSFVAATFAGLAGILAFNVVDGVFGFAEAVAGLAVWIAISVIVYRRSPSGAEESDA